LTSATYAVPTCGSPVGEGAILVLTVKLSLFYLYDLDWKLWPVRMSFRKPPTFLRSTGRRLQNWYVGRAGPPVVQQLGRQMLNGAGEKPLPNWGYEPVTKNGTPAQHRQIEQYLGPLW